MLVHHENDAKLKRRNIENKTDFAMAKSPPNKILLLQWIFQLMEFSLVGNVCSAVSNPVYVCLKAVDFNTLLFVEQESQSDID